MADNTHRYFTFEVVRAPTKALGLHEANAAASEHFYPDHLFEMVQENLIENHWVGARYPDWAGSVLFKALSFEAVRLPSGVLGK